MNPTRILIVEDNADDETLLLRQLRKAHLDLQVRVIADGGRALEYLRNERFNAEELIAVFLDLQLPTAGGAQILEAIRQQERTKHLPVILMTSSNAPDEIDRCRSLGISSFVQKPVTLSAFSKAIADTFHSQQSA